MDNVCRVVCITLGRPMALHIEDIDVELPSVESDRLISLNMESWTALDMNRTSIFVHIVKYRLLCGKIMRAFHGPKKAEHNEAMICCLRDDLASELEDWQRKTRDLSSETPQRPSSFLSKEWYEVIYHNAMLVLFRPCPMLSDTGDAATLQTLFRSSKEAVSLYAPLHRSRKINSLTGCLKLIGILALTWDRHSCLVMTSTNQLMNVTLKIHSYTI
jgi:hypothetical protein